MHRTLSAISLTLALGGGLALQAQTSPASAGQAPSTQKPATGQPRTDATTASDTMLTGCVRSSRADAGTADQKGVVYTLEVTESTVPAAPRPASPQSGAAQPAAASKTTYTLSAPETVGLARHVNHQVQLTGRMTAPATTAATPPPAGAKPIPGGGGGHRTFEVTALKMIAACPSK